MDEYNMDVIDCIRYACVSQEHEGTKVDIGLRLLTVNEVAHCLGLARSRVYLLLDAPAGIPSLRIGRARRVRATALAEYLDRLSQRPEHAPD